MIPSQKTGKSWESSIDGSCSYFYHHYYCYYYWLVVLSILKNISQWEGLSHILWKIKHVWNHQPDYFYHHYYYYYCYYFIYVYMCYMICVSPLDPMMLNDHGLIFLAESSSPRHKPFVGICLASASTKPKTWSEKACNEGFQLRKNLTGQKWCLNMWMKLKMV